MILKGIQILDYTSDFDVPAGVAALMCRRAEIVDFFDALCKYKKYDLLLLDQMLVIRKKSINYVTR